MPEHFRDIRYLSLCKGDKINYMQLFEFRIKHYPVNLRAVLITSRRFKVRSHESVVVSSSDGCRRALTRPLLHLQVLLLKPEVSQATSLRSEATPLSLWIHSQVNPRGLTLEASCAGILT